MRKRIVSILAVCAAAAGILVGNLAAPAPAPAQSSCAYCPTRSQECIDSCASSGMMCCSFDRDCDGVCEEFCGSACPAG